MQKFNKKEYIKSIKSLHSADQADSIESLPFELQSSILKTHTKNFHPDFIAYLREETRDDILHMIPNKQLVNLIKYLDLDESSEQTYVGLSQASFNKNPRMRYGMTQYDMMDNDREQARTTPNWAFFKKSMI